MRVLPTGRFLAPLLAALALAAAPLDAMLPVQQMDHADHLAHAGPAGGGAASARRAADSTLPAGAGEAEARLAASPRHGEWVMIPGGAPGDSVRAWVVYPERSDRAPVVLVVHEIFGLSPWIRAVADQLAADGFIAVAPDLLTSKNLPGSPDRGPDPQAATAAIRTLDRAVVARQLDAVGRYATALPAARDTYGIVGFCWGGGTSFAYATHAPHLGASVVYYGPSPEPAALASVRAPVLGLYGGNDARVNSTVPAVDSAMKAMKKTFEPHFFEGAGHGFLRQQDGQNGANLKATQQAWPLTVAFFRKHLGR